MAIAFRGVGALQAGTTATVAFPLPAGTAEGDLIIVHMGAGEDNPEPALTATASGYAIRGSKLFYDYGPGSITQRD